MFKLNGAVSAKTTENILNIFFSYTCNHQLGEKGKSFLKCAINFQEIGLELTKEI